MFASGFNPKRQPKFRSAIVGNYRLLALVGQGQFAQVYAAVHIRTGKLVAIKQTRHVSETAHEPLDMHRLNHPNIVRAQEISKTKLGYRLVLEYCEGGTLRSHLTSLLDLSTTLPLTKSKQLISDILQGLSHIHQQGIVHGDLKPENIFVTYRSQHSSLHSEPQLRLKIGDFGSARFSHSPNRSRREIGSPTYAAPERFSGKSSPVSDLYSVGIILYELLLGDRPFTGSPDELKQAHQTQPVPFPPNITFATKQLLEKALNKQPSQRFASADNMLSALQNITAVTTDTPHTAKILSGLSHANLTPKIAPIPSNGIMAPVEALLSIPQGCCIITERSLHVLTPKRKLLSIARFSQPCWISVSPSGKWFTAITKQNNHLFSKEEQNKKEQETKQKHRLTTKHTRRYSQGMLGNLGNHSGHRWRRAITLAGPLLTTLQAQVLQIIALDERYLLRVSTTPSKTYFEGFTRHGQFISEYELDLPLAQVTPTMVPYQLMALSAPTPNTDATVLLITLKPFQIKRVYLPALSAKPERVNAFPWGYIISHQRQGLILDRSAQTAGLLTGLPSDSTILPSRNYSMAAIDNQNILLATAKPSTLANRSTTNRPSSLLAANISSLDLGIIF